MLSELRHFLPSSLLVNIYNALITPYLTYGLISWGDACTCKTYLDKIPNPSKTYGTLNIFCKQTRSCHSLFVNVYVLPLNFLYYESVLNLRHDTDERNAPINILNLFSRTSNSHYYSTLSSTSQNFYIKNLLLIYKRMRFLVLAQRCGMRCQI